MNTAIEIFGVVTGLLYLYYEIRHDSRMWYLGIVMALVYIYLFAMEGLYASMSYQIYYLVMSVYGIVLWKRDLARGVGEEGDTTAIVINRLRLHEGVISVSVAAAVFSLLYFVIGGYTDDSQPLLDSLVTVLSLLATYWLGRSFIQQWLLWVVINLLSILLYIRQGLYPTAVLYVFYTISAIYGYYYWKKRGVVLK